MVQQKLVSFEKSNDTIKSINEKIVPQIRFSEFSESWEKLPAGEIFKNVSNKKHDGTLPILAVTQDKGVVRRDELDMDIITSEKSVKSYKIIEPGDFVISLRSFQGGIEYSYIEGICSPAYTILKPKRGIYDDFYKFYLKKDEFISRLNYAVIGIRDGKQISYKDFSEIKIPYTNPAEQKKIANFLNYIDKKIELLEKKIVLLQEFDLSMKNKIFNNSKNYPLVKLNNICLIKKGKQLNKSDMVEDGEYYVLNGGQEPSGYTNSWNVQENTITISEGGNSCGFVYFNSEKFYCGGHCYYLTLTQEDFDLNYLFHYLKYIEPKIMRLRVGSGLPNIQKGDIENINILKMDYNNQKEIGRFFGLINQKISLTLKEKKELIIFKKGLLQKMFV